MIWACSRFGGDSSGDVRPLSPPIPGLLIDFEGETLPVTNMFDADGIETRSLNAADRFVAGPRQDGQWVCVPFESACVVSRN